MTERKPFPRDPAEFPHDDRISFSTTDNKYLLVDENNQEWEFNAFSKAWTQAIDEEEFQRNKAAWEAANFGDTAFSSDEAPQPMRASQKKRKASVGSQGANKPKQPKQPSNRAIYITNLPADTTVDELEQEFTKVAGVIDTGDNGNKRITMYRNPDGSFKGEALIVFFRPESVNSAILALDGMSLRLGDRTNPPLTVQVADTSYKKQKTGNFSRAQKAKRIALAKAQQQKLDEWSDDDPSALTTEGSKWDKIVILKNFFTLEELEDDHALYIELKAEVREDAQKYGEVTNVVLYDGEEDGIITIRFKTAEAASNFVQANQNRPILNDKGEPIRKTEVSIATSRPRFKKCTKQYTEENAFDDDDDDNMSGKGSTKKVDEVEVDEAKVGE